MKLNSTPLNFDAAATNPVHPEVLQTFLECSREFNGNPSSFHSIGKRSNFLLEQSRSQIANFINVDSDDLIFTSGATESLNISLQGAYLAQLDKGNHIITSRTEHKAVLNTLRYLQSIGAEVTYVDLDEYGRVEGDSLDAAITCQTTIVCLMHVNNETGVINDVKTIADICRSHRVTFITDATQAIGHIPTDYSNEGFSFIALSAHKFGGPIGIGALIKKRNCHAQPILFGGGHSTDLRPGTVSPPLVAAMAKACEILDQNYQRHLELLVERSQAAENYLTSSFGLTSAIPIALRSPHIIPMLTNDESGSDFIHRHEQHFVASTGSACNSGLTEFSHVAKNVERIYAPENFVRISLPTHANPGDEIFQN